MGVSCLTVCWPACGFAASPSRPHPRCPSWDLCSQRRSEPVQLDASCCHWQGPPCPGLPSLQATGPGRRSIPGEITLPARRSRGAAVRPEASLLAPRDSCPVLPSGGRYPCPHLQRRTSLDGELGSVWGPPLLLAPQMLYQCSCPWAGRPGKLPKQAPFSLTKWGLPAGAPGHGPPLPHAQFSGNEPGLAEPLTGC